MFKIVACINQKKVLGKDGKLIFHISNDLENFRRMTINNVVIMGRKTFEELPNGKPLKDRINIILSSDDEFGVDLEYDNVYIAHSINDVIELCEAFFQDKELFVIGGEKVYHQFMEQNLVDEMRLTIVDDNSDGDVFFPEYVEDEWYTYYKSTNQTEGSEKPFYFVVLKKKKTNGE